MLLLSKLIGEHGMDSLPAIGQFVLVGWEMPGFALRYHRATDGRPSHSNLVEVCLFQRKELVVARIEQLKPLNPSRITGGLIKLRAIIRDFGVGHIIGEEYIDGLLYIVAHRPGDTAPAHSGLCPIDEIVLLPP